MLFLRNISFIIISTIIFGIASPVKAQQVPLNIAIVDFKAVLGTASAPKSIREQVTSIRTKYRKEVQQQETALRKGNQELAQKQSLLSSEAFKEERRKFEQKVLEVQKNVQQKNLNLQNAQTDAQNKVKIALRKIVLKISQEKSFTLVLRREQTIVVAEQLDITKEVIAALNKQLPNVKVFNGK